MGYPDSNMPKREGNNNQVFDPTPPPSITNACVFCGHVIDDDVLEKPGIIHKDCHRPTCPDCIEDLKQTGLWGCWYCSTVDIDERNPDIKKELEKIRDEKLRERQQPIERHRVDIPTIMTTDSSWTGGDVPEWRATANSDEYPYRDPPNLLDREEGWGFVRPDLEDEIKPGTLLQRTGNPDNWDEVEPASSKKDNVMGVVVGSKVVINGVRGTIKELKMIADLIMQGEEIDHEAFGKDETYGQIYTRIDWKAVDIIAGYTLNEDARSHVVAEIMKKLQSFYVSPYPEIISGKELIANTQYTKEEAQRGTGRTTQRIKSVFGHFIDGPVGLRKDFDTRRILYLVDNRREVKRITRVMTQEWEYGFYRKLGRETLTTIEKRTDILPVKIALNWGGLAGKHYSLVIADITYAAMVQDGKKINKMLQYIRAPIIGDVITG